jgi:hypothetical protein
MSVAERRKADSKKLNISGGAYIGYVRQCKILFYFTSSRLFGQNSLLYGRPWRLLCVLCISLVFFVIPSVRTGKGITKSTKETQKAQRNSLAGGCSI